MKVAVVSDYIESSGMTQFCVNYFGDSKYSIQPISIAPKDQSEKFFSRCEEKWEDPIFIFPANRNLMRHNLEWLVFALKNRGNYDLIYFNASAAWNFLPVLFFICLRYKLVIHSHSDNYSHQPSRRFALKILNTLHKMGKRIFSNKKVLKFACSNKASEWMFENGTIKDGSVKIIDNAINLKKFEFDRKTNFNLREEIGVSSESIVIGHVGILSERKNQQFLLEILKELVAIDKKYCLVLVGDGPIRVELEEKAKLLGVENSVHFVGNVSNVSSYYSIFNVFLYPSISEGLGMALIEAQANGLKCYVSKAIVNEAKCLPNVTVLEDRWDAKDVSKILENDRRCTMFERLDDADKWVKNKGYDLSVKKSELEEYLDEFMEVKL